MFQHNFQMKSSPNLKRLAVGFTTLCILIFGSITIYNDSSGTASNTLVLNQNEDQNEDQDNVSTVITQTSTSNQSKPIILYWNEYFQKEYNHFIPNENTSIQCPYDCIHTSDRNYGSTAKVRIFHERNFNSADIPPNNQNALNVYYTLEPPYLSYSKYNDRLVSPDYFNLTASYRSNSEIYFPYDMFVEKDGTETEDQVWTEEQIDKKIAGKSRTALIAMSNCKAESKRHEYVKALDKYMKITKLGRCQGNTKCQKDSVLKVQQRDLDCMQKLIDEHYFYLSFENSVCPEYVTEKFWRLKKLIVPVVLSRAVMPLHIPNDTYIAASDFESPQALSDYLQYLMTNTTEYKKFFEWTKTYRKSRVTEEEIMVSCQLCKLAYRKKQYRMDNYKEYWSNKQCVKNYALNLLTNQPNDFNNVVGYEQRLTDLMQSTYRPRSIGNIL